MAIAQFLHELATCFSEPAYESLTSTQLEELNEHFNNNKDAIIRRISASIPPFKINDTITLDLHILLNTPEGQANQNIIWRYLDSIIGNVIVDETDDIFNNLISRVSSELCSLPEDSTPMASFAKIMSSNFIMDFVNQIEQKAASGTFDIEKFKNNVFKMNPNDLTLPGTKNEE